MPNTLFLGSSSPIRQQLIKDMNINFQVIDHRAHEEGCDWQLPLEKLAPTIARAKIESITLPLNLEKKSHYLLTADSIAADSTGKLYAKPTDRSNAIQMITALRGTGRVATAFCIDKRRLINTTWHQEARIIKTVIAEYTFDMPDHWIEKYLDATPHYQSICGGLTIEGFGAQFLHTVRGSYSTILGLPVFEVRQALEELDFYKD